MTAAQTLTVADFLLQRIADDEAAANYANNGGRWESWNRSWDTEPARDIAANGVRLFTVPTMYDEHIARHDPARVLAECAAKRRLIDLWSGWDRLCPPGEWPESGDLSQAPMADAGRFMLRTLAKVYADHAEYRSEWAP